MTRVPVADVLAQYAWIRENDGLTIPIDPDEYYVIGVEANGNLNVAHRRDGQLLLFAPDHASSGVTPLPGRAPHPLLTIDTAPDPATWIEVCAKRWQHR